MISTTNTGEEPVQWLVDDDIVRLREWGSGPIHDLDPNCDRAMTIGTAAGCDVRIRELAKPRRVSREHALLERSGAQWFITDNESTNGLFLDGTKRGRCLLVPGTEISLGLGVALIAESPRLIAMHAALTRVLGWADERAEAVDLALRAIRLAATRRSVLVLRGEGNLVPIAEELHDLLLPGQRFVVCSPDSTEQESRQFSPRRVQEGLAALREAAGGTVCLLYGSYPRDFIEMLLEARRPDCLAQLVVCADRAVETDTFSATPIVLPPVRTRRKELDRLINEYVAVAAGRLSALPCNISPSERAWIREQASETLADIQTATLRLTALRHGGSMTEGAVLLGISDRGLRKWFSEHRFQDYGP